MEFDRAFQVRRDGRYGFVPGNPLEFAFAAISHAFHGIPQPGWIVQTAAQRAALQARTQLGPAGGVGRIVGADPGDDSIFDVRRKPAASPAIVVAGHRHRFRAARRGAMLPVCIHPLADTWL
jgi:hypothetical protein